MIDGDKTGYRVLAGDQTGHLLDRMPHQPWEIRRLGAHANEVPHLPPGQKLRFCHAHILYRRFYLNCCGSQFRLRMFERMCEEKK
jgi:hypothetical protein